MSGFENLGIINKYQGVAPKQVIAAVEKAARRTGADFSFLMEKAAAESSFNPKAKSRSSSATGLFQFIEGTWLNMVKKYGPKYGLSQLSDKITVKDGKASVADSDVRRQILSLRKNPEISALMAGEFCEENKCILEGRTQADVGATELYLAHFMGAGGAVKFLNSREQNGNALAARLFPEAARANKNVFFDAQTKQPRTLDQIYDLFAKKFDDVSGGANTPSTAATPDRDSADAFPAAVPAFQSQTPTHQNGTQAPSSSELARHMADEIIWSDDPRFATMFQPRSAAMFQTTRLSPLSVLMLAEISDPFSAAKDANGYNA